MEIDKIISSQIIDQLIHNDKVQYKSLRELADVGTGKSNRVDATPNGLYPFYVRSKQVYKVNEFEFDEEAIIIPGEGGIGEIFHYVVGKYALHQRAYRIHLISNSISTKFVYYYMSLHFKRFISLKAVNATVSSIRKPMIEEFLVPLIPLNLQQEIVNILDKFTQLEVELEAELEARKVQYEYYRNELLSFNDENIEWRSLGGKDGIAEIGTGSRNTIDADKNGLYDFYVRSPEILKLGCYDFDEEAIITSGDGVGVGKILHYVNGKYALHQRAYRFRIRDKNIRTKYVFWYLKKNFLKYILGNAVNSSVSSLRMPVLEKLMIAIPSLEEQDKIISILDKFEVLINDLNIGLPAEINARKKQYEYYRNKLLTFKPLQNG